MVKERKVKQKDEKLKVNYVRRSQRDKGRRGWEDTI